jgi:hypothetical protein
MAIAEETFAAPADACNTSRLWIFSSRLTGVPVPFSEIPSEVVFSVAEESAVLVDVTEWLPKKASSES